MICARGIAACVAALLLGSGAVAQLPPLPASLAADSALLDAARTLRTELDALGSLPAGPARDARIALRRIAFDLLFRGASADAAAQSMPVAGLRLFALRAAVDEEIGEERPDGAATERFRDALARFAAAAAHGLPADPSQPDPEPALAAALRPLEEAIAAAETRPPAIPSTAWPTLAADGAAVPVAAAAAQGPERWSKEETDAALARWSAAIGSAHAPSRRQFEAASRSWVTALRDAKRQPQAGAAMTAFDAELRAFGPGSLERRLRREDPAAREACGGRADDLLKALDRRRADWARGWADGRGSTDASRAMLRAVRTLEAIDALSSNAAEASAERRLGAWGGFAPPDEGWRIHPKALTARLVLAVEALIAGQDGAVDRELAILDRDLPLVLLADGLARTLDPWLAGRPGLGPRLVAVRDAPAGGASLGKRRAELMLLSRLLIEEERSRERRDPRASEELRVAASAVATAVLPAINAPAARLAELRDLAAAIEARAATQRPARPR